MIIASDLDECGVQYYNGLRDSLAEELHLTSEEALLKYPEPLTYGMDSWDFPVDFKTTHSQAVEKGLYKNLKPIQGASERLWQLSNEGHHIIVVTSRFVVHGQHAKVLTQTGEWLDEHKIPYRDIMFVKNKTTVFADVYIDDAPENILGLQALGRKVIIFDKLYNRDIEGLRATNWDEVYQIIKEIETESR